MLRVLGLGAFFSILVMSGFAQDNSASSDDVATGKVSHYISLQANQLFRQLFSLSNTSSSAINNPYLITYSVNNNVSGFGFCAGLGYTFNEFKDGDGSIERETKINDLAIRIGFDKKSLLGKRWILGFGADIVIDNQSNTTTTSNFGGNAVETKDKVSGWGLGPRLSLSFKITEKILVGTEATYYFKSLKNTTELNSGFSNESESTDLKSFQLNVPAVLFLTLKL
jgi:hypothetical protein